MTASPSTDNYQIGKGIVKIKNLTQGDTEYRDVGNVSAFELSAELETLDHFSSRTGVKQKDKSITISQSASLRMVMDEITAENLALCFMGTVDENTAGNSVILCQTLSAVEVMVKFEGTNDVGQQMNWNGKVSFKPSGTFNFISDEWNSLEVTGEVLSDQGALGILELESVTDLGTA